MTTPNADNEPAGQRRADVPRKDDPRPALERADDRQGAPEYVEKPLAGKPRPGEPTYADVHTGDLSPDLADARRVSSENVDPDRYEYAETALGGADAVEKTTYVTGEGTEPAGAPRAATVARTPTGGGINVAAWVIGLIALAVALVYGFGVFR